ncbi:hypothetical protein MSG28_004821 [Choristoneura fumiferana]|uniref:Uncharacterized protein n=1 Tax=Choristoneura fumiferana TaxID=7141 RepID=A0ACC0K7H4_CHOFU|nr:hypothetical protein MSG28_004821 [Choristoneura fumiferana]
MAYRIDDHTKHRIVALPENGVSPTDISAELGITVSIETHLTTVLPLVAHLVTTSSPRPCSAFLGSVTPRLVRKGKPIHSTAMNDD